VAEYPSGYREVFDSKEGSISEIYDSKAPRFAWKDVWHKKTMYEPLIVNGLAESQCDHANEPTFYSWTQPELHVYTFDEIIRHPEVQRALSKAARKWHDKLYQIRPDQLPDMFVFLAELRELSLVSRLLFDYARQMIGLLRMLRSYKRKIKQVARKRYSKRVAKNMIKDLQTAASKVSGDILSLRFGIKQPIRDCTQIIAAMAGYIDTFNFLPRTENIREIAKLHLTDLEYLTGCYGVTCDRAPMFEAPVVEDIEVAVNVSVHFRNLLSGTRIEKLLAVLLHAGGVMPSLDSYWELTRLSWLIDYFFATEKLIGRLEKHTSHIGAIQPVIFDSCVSLKITRCTTIDNVCRRLSARNGAIQKVTDTYYERLSGDGHDLLSLVRWVRMPGGSSLENAVAFLTQTLTGRK
jgi:hypothetical protein